MVFPIGNRALQQLRGFINCPNKISSKIQKDMSEKTKSVWEITKSFKREPDGDDFYSLGADGVLRVYYSIYNPKAFEVTGAASLSTAQIKQYLDYHAFDQAKEDKFRGVDGRGVPDKDLFDPPEEVRFKRPSEEAVRRHQLVVEERRRNPIKVVAGSCGGKKSNYNLDPI